MPAIPLAINIVWSDWTHRHTVSQHRDKIHMHLWVRTYRQTDGQTVIASHLVLHLTLDNPSIYHTLLSASTLSMYLHMSCTNCIHNPPNYNIIILLSCSSPLHGVNSTSIVSWIMYQPKWGWSRQSASKCTEVYQRMCVVTTTSCFPPCSHN